jgi:hypothetical protein
VSEVAIVEIQRQPVGIKVNQPLNVVIRTIGVEIILAPNTNFVRGKVLIGFATNLGCGLGGVLMGRNLKKSLGIPIATIRVVGTLQMVSLEEKQVFSTSLYG